MKTKLFALVLSAMFVLPCMVHAEEVEIQLTEVVEMGVIEGDDPLDGPDQSPGVPTRPTNFRATIDGTTLTVNKQEASIPSAQAIVVNASTGSVVVNQPFTTSISRQIPNAGAYILRIQTANGALVGQFVVQ